MNKEKIEELKKANPSGIYEGEISFTDAEIKRHEVKFVFRKPSTTDIEAFLITAQKNPIVANLNIIQSLIVHPEPVQIIEKLREYPAATNKFVEDVVIPFFGAGVTAQKKHL